VLPAAGLGGHARVGFENNLWLADGGLAATDAQLVEQVSAGARLLGREVADVATTRACSPRRPVNGPAPTADTPAVVLGR
jgi:uncharacterized protein (DUF849 family)